MKFKTELMDADTSRRAVKRIAYEIIEKNHGADGIALIGIERKGAILARLLAKQIEEIENIHVLLGSLDITFYRDDLTTLSEQPVIKGNNISFPIENMNIILVDDVLYTGRTIRAAIDELFDMGRPNKIELAILIDRGHRELPIRADFVGKNVPSSKKENIEVYFDNDDKINTVSLYTLSDD